MRNDLLTVIIHTHNEEARIDACISSVKSLQCPILVVDMNSQDATVSRAIQHGTKIIQFPFSQYVEPAREFGITHASTRWVCILDADEHLTPALCDEIQKIIENSPVDTFPTVTHYRIPRKNMFGGTSWLRHGGWWPDSQIRLIYTPAFIRWPARIHSTPEIKGTTGILKEPMFHFFHGDFTQMVEKTSIYEAIEAKLLYDAKRKSNSLICMKKWLGEYWRRMIRRAGFLDGSVGILESMYQAFSKTITYLYLYESQKTSPH